MNLKIALFLVFGVMVVASEITWGSDCGGTGKLLKPIQLKDCTHEGCTLAINKSYTLSIPAFSPVVNYTDLKFVVSATGSISNQSISLVSETIPGDFQHNKTYAMMDDLFIDHKFINSKDWTIEMTISSKNEDKIICQNFAIKVGGQLGSDCSSSPYEPCDIENSMCLPQDDSYSCQCDYSFLVSDGACKGIVGTFCTDSANCLEKAECVPVKDSVISACYCQDGYESTTDLRECKKSSNSASSLYNFSLTVFTLLVISQIL